MNRKRGLSVVVVVFLMAFIGSMVFQERIASATEAQLVKIDSITQPTGKETGMLLNPETVKIKKGEVVVWLNGVASRQVKLVFKSPLACQTPSIDPTQPSFLRPLHWHDCYTTTYLSYLEATTIQFNDTGTLPYTVVSDDGAFKVSGKVIVE